MPPSLADPKRAIEYGLPKSALTPGFYHKFPQTDQKAVFMRAARKTLALQEIRPPRAALYLRVSTGRQADGDVSLPSQRDLTTRHYEREGWNVVDEYVEPGATGTDDRRPAFQAMSDHTSPKTKHPKLNVILAIDREDYL